MLPFKNRLKLNADFEKVFKIGRTVENDLVKIKFCKNYTKLLRFGFIVSGKFSKKAVERNLIKRRLRAAAGSLKIKDVKWGIDIVIWPKKQIMSVDYQLFSETLKNLLIKNDILRI